MIDLPSYFRSAATLIDDIPGVYVPQDDLETTIADLAMRTVLIAASSLFVLVIIAILFSKRYPVLKMPLFVLMVVAMAGSAVTLVSSTVYLNISADSGGPVHWHADAEFWACGNELELRDPTGFLSNKIGTATLHEHDDHRIHLEGVVVEEEIDASLGKYMYVVGGAITEEQLVVPLNASDNDGDNNIFEDEEDGDGPAAPSPQLVEPYIYDDPELGTIANFKDGDTCGNEVSDVQVFVYNYDEDTKTYEQTKLSNPRDYVITDDPNVPPGDCVIFEFGPARDKTDKLCEQYGIRDIDRCEEFGVEERQKAICEVQQVNYETTDAEPNEEFNAANNIEEEVTVHSDSFTEGLRLACEMSGGSAPECAEYEQILAENPEAQAEADAVSTEIETTETPETEEETL